MNDDRTNHINRHAICPFIAEFAARVRREMQEFGGFKAVTYGGSDADRAVAAEGREKC